MRQIFAALALASSVLLAAAPSRAADGIAAFEGDWRGGSIDLVTPTPLGETLRDLEVKINAHKDGGFVILSLMRVGRAAKSADTAKVRGIEFKPAGQPNVWNAQAACQPEGPAGCAWARLDGNRLIITALDMDKNGAIETQVTVRTIEAGQMKIHFQSFVDGALRRELRGSLGRHAIR